MMESVAERREGGSDALSAPEIDRRDPFARLWMRDRETARPEKPDGGIDVVVSHERRMVELNHAIDSPRWRMREWRRRLRLRQPLRMRRNIRMFFIEFFLQICRGWLSALGHCDSRFYFFDFCNDFFDGFCRENKVVF